MFKEVSSYTAVSLKFKTLPYNQHSVPHIKLSGEKHGKADEFVGKKEK